MNTLFLGLITVIFLRWAIREEAADKAAHQASLRASTRRRRQLAASQGVADAPGSQSAGP